MHIILNHSSMVPIYEQLMEQIKSDIIQSELKLEEEGFVTTVHGKGTYVSASDKQLALEARQKVIEDDFDKVIDRALSMGMKKEEISEVVKLILDEK